MATTAADATDQLDTIFEEEENEDELVCYLYYGQSLIISPASHFTESSVE